MLLSKRCPQPKVIRFVPEKLQGFKNSFFKVRSAESEWAFYLEENTEAADAKKFPLYWWFDTMQILELEKGILSVDEQLLVDFMVKTGPYSPYLQPSELLKWGDDGEVVKQHMSKFP